jgi:cytochrome oxidase assembly protein ShyY1
VYRFLLTARWLGFAALMLALAATMVGLGWWQLSRFHERSAINATIDAAAHRAPVPVTQVLPVGHPPPAAVAWTRISATGRFDEGHQVLVRDRSLGTGPGFEVLTPLVLDDGSAVMVDRGWLALTGSPVSPPAPPAPPPGRVAVTGRAHLPESRPDDPRTIDGRPQVRRIDPGRLAGIVPYPLAGGYVLLDSPAAAGLAPIPSDHQNSIMNAGYVVQWWAFAVLTLVGFGWAARREARGPDGFDLAELDADHPEAPVSPGI